jgi:hypothetical protein
MEEKPSAFQKQTESRYLHSDTIDQIVYRYFNPLTLFHNDGGPNSDFKFKSTSNPSRLPKDSDPHRLDTATYASPSGSPHSVRRLILTSL